jgi:2-keto-4-pentenoate hydratase
VTAQTASAGDPAQLQEIARILLAARKEARPLPAFPGQLPQSLAEAYAIQEAAIAHSGAPIVGWKVGRVPPDAARELGVDHLAGPIYDGVVWEAGSAPTPIRAIEGGFCAIEAEFVFRLGRDAPAEKAAWTAEEAAAFASALHIGVEVAGSPIANLNALGPRAVIADGGATTFLIVGP